jgi:hypothetical protein
VDDLQGDCNPGPDKSRRSSSKRFRDRNRFRWSTAISPATLTSTIRNKLRTKVQQEQEAKATIETTESARYALRLRQEKPGGRPDCQTKFS